MEKIAQGAEAILYSDGHSVLKHRFPKRYRHHEIDLRLRKSRTRREAKVISKLSEAGIPSPKLLNLDDNDMKLLMEYLPGPKLRDVFEQNPQHYSEEIGKLLARLHNENIIHHDLTTSNMILHEKTKQIYLIDFGLSFFSQKVEDKAVDLHLLKHALESRHHTVWQKAFDTILRVYRSNCRDSESILKRLDKVEERGRNKAKH